MNWPWLLKYRRLRTITVTGSWNLTVTASQSCTEIARRSFVSFRAHSFPISLVKNSKYVGDILVKFLWCPVTSLNFSCSNKVPLPTLSFCWRNMVPTSNGLSLYLASSEEHGWCRCKPQQLVVHPLNASSLFRYWHLRHLDHSRHTTRHVRGPSFDLSRKGKGTIGVGHNTSGRPGIL